MLGAADQSNCYMGTGWLEFRVRVRVGARVGVRVAVAVTVTLTVTVRAG